MAIDKTLPSSNEQLHEVAKTYGTPVFVYDEEGAITFLECNSNGQYGWLEESLGLPISDAIASELIKIAKDKN